MRNELMARSRVVVSKCLEFDHCRYDGAMIASDAVRAMQTHVEFVPVCPEMEIGLGVPREPIRVVLDQGQTRLFQPATGLDLTDKMQAFAARFLDSVGVADGFILKTRSPSCGIKEVKVYSTHAAAVGRGFFAAAVLERFPTTAVEDEGRLLNFTLREHFLMRVFTSARFRQVMAARTARALTTFHATHKLLLMACNQAAMRRLGRIAANLEQRPLTAVVADYAAELNRALAAPPRRPASINALEHAQGYFKTGLTAKEKQFFHKTLEQYRAGRVPLSAPVSVLQSWIVRFGEEYLASQVFFNPYPEELVELTDSGKTKK